MKIMRARNLSFLSLSAFSLALTAASTPAQASSFKSVESRLSARPLPALPDRSGLSIIDAARAALTFSGALIERARFTLSSPTDFKKPSPKLFHPMGVCSTGSWIIDRPSPATGLLAQGTSVPAVVRLSTGDEKTQYEPGEKRLMGLAIKLFPTRDLNQEVETKNLFFLGGGSILGEERARFMGPDLNDEPVFFENAARGSGFAIDLLNKAFRKLDKNPQLRPVYPLTEITADGQTVTAPVTPNLLRLNPVGNGAFEYDFRRELMSYAPGTLQFTVSLPEYGNRTIGRLVLNTPTASDACDLELHFHHHPTR